MMKLTKITECQAWAMAWVNWKIFMEKRDNKSINNYGGVIAAILNAFVVNTVELIRAWKKCGVIKEEGHD